MCYIYDDSQDLFCIAASGILIQFISVYYLYHVDVMVYVLSLMVPDLVQPNACLCACIASYFWYINSVYFCLLSIYHVHVMVYVLSLMVPDLIFQPNTCLCAARLSGARCTALEISHNRSNHCGFTICFRLSFVHCVMMIPFLLHYPSLLIKQG